MPYITIKVSPRTHQVTLEELLEGEVNIDRFFGKSDKYSKTLTRTYLREVIPEKVFQAVDIIDCIEKLRNFNIKYSKLFDVQDRHDLYHTFKIPKKSGGLRTINAPNDDLMVALRELRNIFENDCKVLYHQSAYAYVTGRSTLDCVKKHQENQSRWFLKTDFSDFFGSTTKNFILHQFAQIFPFNVIMKGYNGFEALSRALDLCMLDGGLPQGTPISPMITNIMMIPIDAQLSRNLGKDHFVYTRYADDILISCQHDFPYAKIVQRIDDCLASFNAPFKIKPTKTRYGSSAGQNWNLGVMLNKDNNITIGYKNTKRFNAMCSSFILDHLNGTPWQLEDVQHFRGLISYYKMIESDKIDSIIQHYNRKHNVDMLKMVKEALSR